MKNKRKSQIKTLVIFTLILSLISVGSISYMIIKTYLELDQSQNVINGEFGNDFYSIRDNATDYQKEIYNQLSESLKNKDDQEISKLVAQNFITDLYTFSNKISINDVGGIQYLEHSMQSWYYQMVTDTLYNNLPSYQKNGSLADSLTVISSTAKAEKSTMTFGEQSQQGYLVHVTWKYKSGTSFNTSKFENESDVFVVKDETGRFSIYKLTGNQAIQNTDIENSTEASYGE